MALIPRQTAGQQLAGNLQQELTDWNTASLFPEGLGGQDVFRLREAGMYFLQAREEELNTIQPKVNEAAQAQDAPRLLRLLDESLLVEHEIQRARVYFKLMSVQHPQIQGFADLYESVASKCNALDAIAERLPQQLSQLPEAMRQSMLNAAPGLSDHMHALFPERFGRFPGMTPEQGANLSQQISDAKTDYLHEYHLAHTGGSIPGTDYARLNQTAKAFNAMLQTTTTEAKALGYKSPLHHFAAWQHLPADMVNNWLQKSAMPARGAADKMHALLTGNRLKTQMIRLHYPDGGPQKYTLPEARSIVTEALCQFNPAFRPILDDAFENGWVQTRPLGNNPYGGETYNNLPKIFYPYANPMVLSEFRGNIFDVLRLAHELGGHCLSIEMANRNQQPLHVADSTLQESFALFSQRLVTDEMLARTTNAVQRASIQRTVADDWYQNLYETTARCRFQQAAYQAATQADGSIRPLSAPQLTSLFTQTNAGIRYGQARVDPNEPTRWANIHHFVTQMPYYNAAYGFATMASGALYNQWKHAAPGHQQTIANRWTEVMAQGGSVRFPDAMAYLGIDVRSPGFIQAGVQSVDQSIASAHSAMEAVSSLGLFITLKPAQMWQVTKESFQRVFNKPTATAPIAIPKGSLAARPSASAPAQPLYGIVTPTPQTQTPIMPESSAQATDALKKEDGPNWSARYAQQTPASLADAVRSDAARATSPQSWREQAMSSQKEAHEPTVPSWAL